MVVLRRCAVVSSWTAILFAVACGSSSPTSPFRGLGGGGAEIIGDVSGGTQGLTASAGTSATSAETSATTPGKPVTVTIVGTNTSTTVDGKGHFHLTDVPLGDVQLRFTADNLDATITLQDVEAGDEIHIKVRVTDTSVRIEAQTRQKRDDDNDDNDDDDNEFKGLVSGWGGACPVINFTVNGTAVTTSGSTRYEHGSCTSVQNGVRVEVKGIRQTNGSILATKIELEDDDD